MINANQDDRLKIIFETEFTFADISDLVEEDAQRDYRFHFTYVPAYKRFYDLDKPFWGYKESDLHRKRFFESSIIRKILKKMVESYPNIKDVFISYRADFVPRGSKWHLDTNNGRLGLLSFSNSTADLSTHISSMLPLTSHRYDDRSLYGMDESDELYDFLEENSYQIGEGTLFFADFGKVYHRGSTREEWKDSKRILFFFRFNEY